MLSSISFKPRKCRVAGKLIDDSIHGRSCNAVRLEVACNGSLGMGGVILDKIRDQVPEPLFTQRCHTCNFVKVDNCNLSLEYAFLNMFN